MSIHFKYFGKPGKNATAPKPESKKAVKRKKSGKRPAKKKA